MHIATQTFCENAVPKIGPFFGPKKRPRESVTDSAWRSRVYENGAHFLGRFLVPKCGQENGATFSHQPDMIKNFVEINRISFNSICDSRVVGEPCVMFCWVVRCGNAGRENTQRRVIGWSIMFHGFWRIGQIVVYSSQRVAVQAVSQFQIVV